MSSLRNAVKRITHKERSQPQSRAHLGILEKKKDYRVRAKDFHNKQDRIQSMRRKASQRNPDEFYFGMHRTELKDGRHRKTQEARRVELEEQIGPEAVRIMKDQDLKYVRTQKQRDAKKVERMQASLQFLDDSTSKKRKHVVFLENRQEAENFDVAKHFDTAPALAGRAFNRPRLEQIQKAADVDAEESAYGQDETITTEKKLKREKKVERRAARKLAKARATAYGEMEARLKRVKTMEAAEAHLVTEKLVAGKGRKRKIKGAEDGKPAVYKWRRKRAR